MVLVWVVGGFMGCVVVGWVDDGVVWVNGVEGGVGGGWCSGWWWGGCVMGYALYTSSFQFSALYIFVSTAQ